KGLSIIASSNAGIHFSGSQHLSQLHLNDQSKANFLPDRAAAAAAGKFIATSDLLIADRATLDLGDSNLIVSSPPETRSALLSYISRLVKSGRASGKWDGTG